ncbi:M50 family metallopeptidase [Geomicrobium sp. JSM 1781026]|uniref:M50 family metallopeptidase n=1 Tax=Geomicrobium sp. JSM 1781026 TaxID=3344580 RepID=UPI0035BEFEAC
MIDLFRTIRIHPVFWLVIGLAIATGYFRELIMLFCIVFCHEMGHAIAAQKLGWRIKKIELLPFGGVAETEEYGNRPHREEVIVILAGPLQHVFLIGLSFLALSLFPFWSQADHELFIYHNLTILLFNLLPVLPLDGGRLAQVAYTSIRPFREAQQISLLTSLAVLVIVMTLTAMYFPLHLQWWMIIFFLAIANFLEWKQQPYGYQRFLLERKRFEPDVEAKVQSVPANLKLSAAIKQLYKGKPTLYRVIESGQFLEEKDLLRYWFYDDHFYETDRGGQELHIGDIIDNRPVL